MPVDLYIGGAEHAVLHLLYSRFWHKVLFDLGIVSTDEPYNKLYNQGMILAFAYETATGGKVSSDMVEEHNGKYFHTETGEPLTQIVAKMSKSLKNVVNPDDVVASYGADSLRLYEMFLGPLDAVKPWVESGVKGVFNFLNRVFRFFADPSHYHEQEEDPELLKSLHQTIKKVGNDIEVLHFNTAISAVMELVNAPMPVPSECFDLWPDFDFPFFSGVDSVDAGRFRGSGHRSLTRGSGRPCHRAGCPGPARAGMGGAPRD